MHDYVRAAVVHSLQLPRICRGMQYAGFRRRAILYIISKLCTLVVEPGLSIVGRKSCLWIMGKRRKGGGRNTIRNYSICASRIRVVGGFGAGGSGDCFGRLATQTQIKSWKLSAVNECDTRFRNNAKVRCITRCIPRHLFCSRIGGEEAPKQIIGCLVHNTPTRGYRALHYTATTHRKEFLFPWLTSCFLLSRREK